MNPSPARRATAAKKVRRHVLCRHYNQCLNIAVARAWQGFHCDACGKFRMEGETDPNWWDEQNQRAGRILKRILIDAPPRYGSRRKSHRALDGFIPLDPKEQARLKEECYRKMVEHFGEGVLNFPGDIRKHLRE